MAQPRTLRLRNPPMTGDDVRDWQRELRNQFDGMGIDYEIAVDGVYGQDTRAATETLCYALGIEQDDLDAGLTPFIRVKIRNRDLTTAELRRMKDRTGWRRRLRKKHARPQRSGPQIALAEAARHVGKNEARNWSWVISIIKGCIGATYRVPWCGCFVHHCLKTAGVPVTGACASVNAILHNALNGTGGFRSCVYRRATGRGSLSAIQPGDTLGFFGESTHTGLAKKRAPGGWITVEGNTSADNASNGRACEDKFRPNSSIVFAARPDWRS